MASPNAPSKAKSMTGGSASGDRGKVIEHFLPEGMTERTMAKRDFTKWTAPAAKFVLRAFEEFDDDGDGNVSPKELKAALRKYWKITLTPKEVESMMIIYDVDASGVLEYEEFACLLSNLDDLDPNVIARFWAKAIPGMGKMVPKIEALGKTAALYAYDVASQNPIVRMVSTKLADRRTRKEYERKAVEFAKKNKDKKKGEGGEETKKKARRQNVPGTMGPNGGFNLNDLDPEELEQLELEEKRERRRRKKKRKRKKKKEKKRRRREARGGEEGKDGFVSESETDMGETTAWETDAEDATDAPSSAGASSVGESLRRSVSQAGGGCVAAKVTGDSLGGATSADGTDGGVTGTEGGGGVGPDGVFSGGGGAGGDGGAEIHTALRVLFDTLDKDKNGVVDKGEILSVLRNPDKATVELIRGVPVLADLLKPQHYEATFNAMDTNKDGSMQFDELVSFCKRGQHRSTVSGDTAAATATAATAATAATTATTATTTPGETKDGDVVDSPVRVVKKKSERKKKRTKKRRKKKKKKDGKSKVVTGIDGSIVEEETEWESGSGTEWEVPTSPGVAGIRSRRPSNIITKQRSETSEGTSFSEIESPFPIGVPCAIGGTSVRSAITPIGSPLGPSRGVGGGGIGGGGGTPKSPLSPNSPGTPSSLFPRIQEMQIR
jgi:Ca2+-binding EF-hand superfamily protein